MSEIRDPTSECFLSRPARRLGLDTLDGSLIPAPGVGACPELGTDHTFALRGPSQARGCSLGGDSLILRVGQVALRGQPWPSPAPLGPQLPHVCGVTRSQGQAQASKVAA